MSKNLHKLLRDALLNNSYDKSSMDLSLTMTHQNSYSYLYTLQRSIIDYDEFHYQSNTELFENKRIIGKFYLDKSNNACVDIDYELIKEALREIYRRSRFYHVKITKENKSDYISIIHDKYHELDKKVYIQTDFYTRLLTEDNIDEYIGHVVHLGLTPQYMWENPDIFRKIPVIMIDNQVIWDWILFCNEGSFTIKIPSKGRNFVIQEDLDDNRKPIYVEHQIDVFTIDNVFPITTFRANRSSLNYIVSSKTFKFPKSKLNGDLTKTSDGIMFCSFHYPNKNGTNYELGSSLIELREDGDYYTGTLTDYQHLGIISYDIDYNPSQEKFFYVKVFFINRLRCHHYVYETNEGLKTIPYTTIRSSTDGSFTSSNLAVLENGDYLTEVDDVDIPYQMPVPVENLLVFHQKIGDDEFVYDYTMCRNVDAVKLYYPNIYQINDENQNVGDRYKIYYFYKEGDSLLYTPMFDFYMTYLKNILYKVRDKKLEVIYNDLYFGTSDDELTKAGYSEEDITNIRATFIKILKYIDFYYHYGDIDFLKRFLPIKENSDKTPFEYKVETLREWVKHDRDALQKYVNEQKHVSKMYHMFASTIDLEARRRTDTSVELDGSVTFDEDMYVFTFADVEDIPEMLNIRIYVDGIFVNDFYQERENFMDYIFIPVRYFTPDSYIEAEVFPEYTFEKEITFNSLNDEKVISLIEPRENINPTISDLYIISNSEDEETVVKANHLFKISNEYKEWTYEIDAQPTLTKDFDTYKDLELAFKNGELSDKSYYYDKETGEYYYYADTELYSMGSYYENHSVEFARLNSIRIVPKVNSVVNIPLNMVIHKKGYGMNLRIPDTGFVSIELTPIGFKFSKKNIRIYINGRLYPDQNYILTPDENKPTIRLLEKFNKDDIIYLDLTPFKYNKVYENEDITNLGRIIDLKEYLNKPFDPRYYDVYMNGRRLSLNNIIQVDPWSITLVNLKSNYNFVIYEKERDHFEYFGLDYTEDLYYFNIEDLIDEPYIDDKTKNDIIDEIINDRKDPDLVIEDNTNDEEKDNIVDIGGIVEAKIFYWDEIVPRFFMNPDVAQFDDTDLKETYPYHYEKYLTSPYNETKDKDKISYISALRLDPDDIFVGGPDGKDKGCYVYAVGHLDDVPLELLSSPLEMNNDKDLVDTIKRKTSI